MAMSGHRVILLKALRICDLPFNYDPRDLYGREALLNSFDGQCLSGHCRIQLERPRIAFTDGQSSYKSL
jgi:hypothetical protein